MPQENQTSKGQIIKKILSSTLLVVFAISITSCSLSTNAKKSESKGEAKYKLTFNATWSSQTHPKNFPSNPHFSPLIGGMHNKNTSLWEIGKIASEPIQVMAETGKTDPLMDSMNNNQDILFIIKGSPLKPSPKKISLSFEANKTHPYLTLVSMLAPSPDWFVGVDSLNLLDSNGEWMDDITVDLVLFDAGSDNGKTFTASNTKTNPKEPIEPLSDTENTNFKNGKPIVGSFTLTKQKN